jgi:hypothetical protein
VKKIEKERCHLSVMALLDKKSYYSALKDAKVDLIEDLAIRAGYCRKVDLHAFGEFNDRYKELEMHEEEARNGDLKLAGMSLTTGPGWIDPTNYLRAFEKGFVRLNERNGLTVLAVLETKVVSSNYASALMRVPGIGGERFASKHVLVDTTPHILLYCKKTPRRDLQDSNLLSHLGRIVAEYDPNSLLPQGVRMGRSMFKVMRNAVVWMLAPASIPVLHSTGIINEEQLDSINRFFFSNFFPIIGTMAVSMFYPFVMHDQRYNKGAIRRLIRESR